MTEIPITHRYYPSVPLHELSDLYSKGNQHLGGKRALIISYLPKTLRIGRDLPFNNRYALFIESTAAVDSIQWSFTLFLNGQVVTNPNFILAPSSVNETEYTLFFLNDVIDPNRQPQFDRLRVACEVVKDGETVVLTLEHNLIALLNATGLPSANVISGQSAPFSGNLDTTNFILNHLKDYLPAGLLAWNNFPIEIILTESETLLKIVVAILYNNILVSENISSEFSFFFDINQYANVGIRSFLNLNDPYDGSFTNGLCRLPLHILNDILPAIHQAPDYTTIDAGSGNAVYNIIRDQGLLTYNDLEGDVLRTIPQRIQDSKQRLKNDRARFVELYNLSLFPRPAIRLAAILVKYLLACSQLNQCGECKDKNPLWTTLTLAGLKDHPNFLKNILTHYFREPSNRIETYARDAARATTFVWSPAVYTILNAPPRIVKAYFAKKVVRQIDDLVGGAVAPVHIFDFERIDSTAVRLDQNGNPINPQPAYDAILGQKIYLVVETLHSRNREITLNIQTGDNHLTGNPNEVLALLSGRDDLSRTPADFQNNIQRTVGAFDDLRNNNNDDFNQKEKEYYKIDHQDRAVVKLRLTGTEAEFTNWANNLGANLANLKIAVRFSDDTPAFFGNDISATRVQDSFLGADDKYANTRFRLANQIIYEIYHTDNRWNFLTSPGAARRRIGKTSNNVLNVISYLYYDPHDNEHEICTTTRFLAEEKGPRQNIIPPLAARGALLGQIDLNPFRNAGEDIDATTLDLHQNGTVAHGDNGDRWYPNTGNQIYMINADIVQEPGMGPQNFRALDYQATQLRVRYFFQDTRRRSANPDVFAGIIGALAKLYLTPNPVPNPNNINYRNVAVISEGFAYEDGSCYPSTMHRNGLAFDTHYLDPPRAVQQTFVNAMTDYYFQRNIVGANGSGHTGYANSVADNGAFGGIHNHHMHSDTFHHTEIDNIV
jgi:hypothetical protein